MILLMMHPTQFDVMSYILINNLEVLRVEDQEITPLAAQFDVMSYILINYLEVLGLKTKRSPP